MKKVAVILYGSPGSGKGTQANLLAGKLGLVHFDTGKFLEAVVHDPARQKDKFIKQERENFDGGRLVTPDFVLKEVSAAVEKIAKAGFGVVFSGSPRTVYEAKGLVPMLERLYGRENIFIFELRLPPQESIRRNSRRVVCSSCGYALLTAYYPGAKAKFCPVCGGKFYKRTLDKPEVIRVRLEEYRKRTQPVFVIMKSLGYEIPVLDAKPAPFKILTKLMSIILARGSNIGRKPRAVFAGAKNVSFYQLLS